jgi:hypothetical protein
VTRLVALSYTVNGMQLLMLTIHKIGYPVGQFSLPDNFSKGNALKILQNT